MVDHTPAAVAPGVQPQWRGRLRCLDCGSWFANLASHIGHRHGSLDDYRRRHRLAAEIKLQSAAMRRRTGGVQARDPQSALQRGARRLAQQRLQPYEQRAAEFGFASLRDLLAAHRAMPAPQLAAMLGVPKQRVAYLRSQYGRPAPARPRGTAGFAEPGVQPEDDGYLLCLECGRWFRHVGLHAINAHGIDADSYRHRHELPATLPLCATDLRAFFARKADSQYASTPAIQQGFAANRARLAEFGPPPPTYTGDRAGVRAIRRRAALDLQGRSGRVKSERVHAGYDATARQLGYAGLADLLARNRTLYAREVGVLLGVTAGVISKLRQRHGLPTRTRRRPEDFHQRPPAPVPVLLSKQLAAELAAIPHRIQPQRDGTMRCLECGAWLRGLAQHLVLKHGLDIDDYRMRHGVPATMRLTAPPSSHRAG